MNPEDEQHTSCCTVLQFHLNQLSRDCIFFRLNLGLVHDHVCVYVCAWYGADYSAEYRARYRMYVCNVTGVENMANTKLLPFRELSGIFMDPLD